MENISTYFIINIFTIIIPFIFSFDKKVAFYKSWPAFFPALFITALLFIAWDVIFTQYGVWGFNELHLQGIYLAGLPVEEWLFFVTIPYAVVFTYRVLNVWFPMNTHSEMQRTISYALIIIMLAGTLFFYDRLYSVMVFSLSAIFILIVEWFRASWLLHFYRTFLIILFPFFIVNGILTGTWLNEPVVWYNNSMNAGIRLATIPMEDIA
ncbi:MAG: lycopene cyclase domain-containing protein, partial [Marinilabiliaceae bacterium]